MNLSEALAEAGKWGNLIRALSAVDEVLKEAASQEQLKAERTKLLDDLNASVETARADLQKAKDDAAAVLDDARTTASSLIADAKEQAASLVASAGPIVDDAKAAAQAASDEKDTHIANADAAKAELASTQAELAKVKQQIADALAAAREKFGA